MKTRQEIQERVELLRKDAQHFQEMVIDDPQDEEAIERHETACARLDILEWVLGD